MMGWLPRLVARVPATVHAKLLGAFLTIVVLLIAVGTVGLQVLSGVNRRADDRVRLQRKIAAYRQLQHDTTSQLYTVASALLAPDEQTLEATLRQLNAFGYTYDRLQFIARDEVELLAEVRANYGAFTQVVTKAVELIRTGRVVEGRNLQLKEAGPLADKLERVTNQLVNRAQADMVDSVEAGESAYRTSRRTVVGFAVGSIGLALLLGYAISWSLIEPVTRMDVSLRKIASGDFSQKVEVGNRDELGALADNLNRMREELGSLYAQLEAANRHKSEFLANMSHELRTPLNAVIGFSEILLQRMFGEMNEKQEEYLRDIRESGAHLLALINDILDLSKIEAGRMELEVADFDLPQTVSNALILVRERAMHRELTLNVTIGDGVATVRGDERKIKQVLLNLLSNAIKFTPEGGRITVHATAGTGCVQVSVTDTGIGIAPEDQGVIFEEFRQVGSSAAKQEGTGLGLALCRKFIELHGGTIWVSSEAGKGSAFTFALPVAREG